jgi:hypothetical protein
LGSGIRDGKKFGSGIRDKHPGSATLAQFYKRQTSYFSLMRKFCGVVAKRTTAKSIGHGVQAKQETLLPYRLSIGQLSEGWWFYL